MVFLNPAVLFGLLAASIPVLIHLLNLRKLKKIEFSTLAFLKELQKNKIRKIKIKQWLLLALRVAIIFFLVFAFARPTLEGVAIGGTTSAAKTSAVYILDDTFSMSVIDGNGSYLNQAKKTLKDLVEHLQEGDEAALLLVSENNNDVKLSNNLQDILKQADAVNPSYARGYINNAVVKAADLLAGSNNFNKEIYLLSDYQKTGLAQERSLSDLSQLLNDKVNFYTLNYSGKNVFNIGIDDLKLNTQIFQTGKPIRFKVTVTNYSGRGNNSDLQDGVVSLFVNGERKAQQSISLPAGKTAVLDMETTLEHVNGNVNIYTELEDDDIMQDNKHYLSINIPGEVPVAVFSDTPDDAKFMELALTVSNDGTLKITEKNSSQLASTDLSQFKALFIIGGERISASDRLRQYVENGGGLFILPGSSGSLTSFNSLLGSIGLPAASGESNSQSAFVFQNTDFKHPLFENIFSGNVKKSIESPDVFRFFRVSPAGKGLSIISLNDNSSFLTDYKAGKGKVLVLSSAPSLAWSNFPLKSIFAPLINTSVFYLASTAKQDEEYYAGSPVDINLSGITMPQIKITRPDNTEEFVNTGIQSTGFIQYDKTSAVGNYSVYSGNNLVDYFSVNTDAPESKAEYLSSSDFDDYLDKINFKGKHFELAKNEDPQKLIMQARFGSELWKFFLILSFLLAAVEMAVARNAKKEIAEASA